MSNTQLLLSATSAWLYLAANGRCMYLNLTQDRNNDHVVMLTVPTGVSALHCRTFTPVTTFWHQPGRDLPTSPH
jgi:hypothetical protein